jgi:hypothetical protein
LIKKIVNGKEILAADERYSRLEIERWLINRVAREITSDDSERWDIIANVRRPDLTFDQRREAIAALILRHDLSLILIGKKADGEEETFAASYRRFYGVALPVP